MDLEELMKQLVNAKEMLENCGTENVEAYMLPCQIKKLKEYGYIKTSTDGQEYALGVRIKEWPYTMPDAGEYVVGGEDE